MNEQDKVFDSLPPSIAPGLTLKEVSERTGMKPPQAKKHLDEMQANGKVWRLQGVSSSGRGRAPYLYLRADTTGYSRMLEPWESELIKCVEDNPDQMCFCATYVNEKGALDEMMALTEWYPNRHEPFEFFHAVWSITHKNYMVIPGCYFRDDKKEDVVEVEKFRDQKEAYDWLLNIGVDLKRKGILPDGRPLPTEPLPKDVTEERMQRIEVGPPVPVAEVPTSAEPPEEQSPSPTPGQYELIAMRRRGMSTGSIAAYYNISKEEVLALLLQRA